MSRPGEKAAVRAEAQRARILDAAKAGFITDGFHAATMATIAERAGMSAGLIYRYFESKEAIVLALIERELEVARDRIAKLRGTRSLTEGLVGKFADMASGDPESWNAALFLEISAEATRTPEVAQAVAHADRLTRADFQAWLELPVAEGGRGLAPADAATRALLLQVVFSGMAVRAAREPALDRELLRRALDLALATV